MAVFQGVPTVPQNAGLFAPIQLEKLVYTREDIPWADPHPEDPRKMAYRVYVRQFGNEWAVFASLGANDSVRRVFATFEAAEAAFNRIQHWTMVKTLRARGFQLT